jgi:uncharacterized membrane protein YhaH (DUF805 family)
MAFCSNCGAKIEEGVKFCTNCGAQVEVSAPVQPLHQQAPQQHINVVNAIPQTPYQQPPYPAEKKNGWQYFCDAMKKYAVFQGRARRAEYWYFILLYDVFYIPCLIIDYAAGLYVIEGVGVLSLLVNLVFLLPGWGVLVRRYHDVDKRAWFGLVPIYNLILLFSAGTVGQNRFGPDPKQTN